MLSSGDLKESRSRRRGPKSKTGCRQCKTRKIKCDETPGPSCRNCFKHNVQCDRTPVHFASAPDVARDPAAGFPPTPPGLTPECSVILSPVPVPVPVPTHDEAGLYTINDLELLHHYTTSTCLTFTQDATVRSLYRVTIPHMAFTTPYLLRAILAVSALHMARFRPEKRAFLVEQASRHHSVASSLATPLVTTVDPSNCSPIFLFATMTLYFALARPKNTSDLFVVSVTGHMPQWLFLFRGIRHVLEAEMDVLQTTSPLKFMLLSGMKTSTKWETSSFENEAFAELVKNLSASVPEAATLESLLSTVALLKSSFAYLLGDHSDDEKEQVLFIWLYRVSDEYLDLVRSGDSEALCVFAFACVLMRRLEYKWYMEGWGLHLVERIYANLGERHRLWIRWPIEEIGWVPSSD